MTIRKAETVLLSEQELEGVAAGGRSQCENDDGSSSGGSTPKPKPKPSGSFTSGGGARIFDTDIP